MHTRASERAAPRSARDIATLKITSKKEARRKEKRDSGAPSDASGWQQLLKQLPRGRQTPMIAGRSCSKLFHVAVYNRYAFFRAYYRGAVRASRWNATDPPRARPSRTPRWSLTLSSTRAAANRRVPFLRSCCLTEQLRRVVRRGRARPSSINGNSLSRRYSASLRNKSLPKMGIKIRSTPGRSVRVHDNTIKNKLSVCTQPSSALSGRQVSRRIGWAKPRSRSSFFFPSSLLFNPLFTCHNRARSHRARNTLERRLLLAESND